MTDRGRLTPVDVVYIAAGLAALAFLTEPLYQVLDTASVDPGTDLLFRMLPPALIAMLLFVIYRTALIGSGGG